MTNIYLHVGLGKTGSTYIQTVISSNLRLLEDYEVIYPFNSSIADSGNGHLLFQTDSIQSLITSPISSKKILFSREHFARELSDHTAIQSLDRLFKASSINQVFVLLFVRNAFDHCYSLWSQKVKNTQESRSFQRYARSYDSLSIASSFITNAISLDWNIKVVNYSVMGSPLESIFFSWLDPFFPVHLLSIPTHSSNVSPSYRSITRKRFANKFITLPLYSSFQQVLISICTIFSSRPSCNLFYIELWSQQVNTLNTLLQSEIRLKQSVNSRVLFETLS